MKTSLYKDRDLPSISMKIDQSFFITKDMSKFKSRLKLENLANSVAVLALQQNRSHEETIIVYEILMTKNC